MSLIDDFSNEAVGTSLAGFVGAYMFEAFLYGINVILFALCIYVLWVPWRTPRWPFLLAVSAMLAISTADIGVTLHFLFRFILQGRAVPAKNTYPKRIFLVSNNTIAGCLILYRCYIIWSRKRRVIAFPCLLLFSASSCGFVFSIPMSPRLRNLLPIYLWIAFGFNMLIAILIAARILWLARTARSILGVATARRCLFFFALIIGSGVIYPIYLLLNMVVDTIVIDAGLIQVVCIAPALMVVQVGLSRYTQEAQTDIALQHIGQQQSSSTPVLDSVFSTVGTAGGGGNAGGVAQTPHQSQTQISPPQEEERHDNDDV